MSEYYCKDKLLATTLISKYFKQVVPFDYRYNHETFIQYEMIAKSYAILEVLKSFRNSHKKKLLIEIIKGL